jgi:hypothetical protein
MSQDWLSDSDDSDKLEWESDAEAEPSSVPALRNLGAAGPSTLVRHVLTDRKLFAFQHATILTFCSLVFMMILL